MALITLESQTRLSESTIWKLNRSFYEEQGIDAWSRNEVPSHITSNSMVGKTYAELIFALLQDFQLREEIDRVYILEMGAGHGKLAFYVLTHLEKLLAKSTRMLPAYTYVLSDIAELNLDFFLQNEQLKPFIDNGLLDVCYFDAVDSGPMYLRHSEKLISQEDALSYPLIGIGNYFLDSIPTDLFRVEQGDLYIGKADILLDESPQKEKARINDLQFSFTYDQIHLPIYHNELLNSILESYRKELQKSYFFIPTAGVSTMEYLASCSRSGLIMLTMDKGFHRIDQLESNAEPELIQHGSTSIWVNFHALQSYTALKSGVSYSPSHSHVHINLAAYAWLKSDENLESFSAAYARSVDDFGPNEMNSLMKFSYLHIVTLSLTEILATLRMNQYDPQYFNKVLPRIKQICQNISKDERDELYLTIPKVYALYFYIGEADDFTYELGALMFDMAFYKEAIFYFQKSLARFGPKPDVYYNMAVCFYQLRKDAEFLSLRAVALREFPNYEALRQLEHFDMNAD